MFPRMSSALSPSLIRMAESSIRLEIHSNFLKFSLSRDFSLKKEISKSSNEFPNEWKIQSFGRTSTVHLGVTYLFFYWFLSAKLGDNADDILGNTQYSLANGSGRWQQPSVYTVPEWRHREVCACARGEGEGGTSPLQS